MRNFLGTANKENILTINGLTKKYGAIRAVDGLDLEVNKGEIYGLLGPNGSGKTTTLGIIMGITKQNKGSYTWFGQSNHAASRKRIGVLLETPNFYSYLNAEQNLNIIAHIKRVKNPEIDELLSLVNLALRKKSLFSTYSLGMKQRLAIAGALIGDPDVLIFDEPTNGLDPEGIAEVREIILKIAARGKTIIMASHILDEVEKICSHVAIIKFGELLKAGAVTEIMSEDKTVEIAARNLVELQAQLAECDMIAGLEKQANGLTVTLKEGFQADDLNHFVFQKGISLTHLLVKQRSLEEEFLDLTRELKN